MSLKVKLENKDGIIEKKKGLDVSKGVCVFPFVHKDVEYNECFKGAKGNWCATEVNPKTNKIRKWAYCDPDPKNNNYSNYLNKLIEDKFEEHKKSKETKPKKKFLIKTKKNPAAKKAAPSKKAAAKKDSPKKATPPPVVKKTKKLKLLIKFDPLKVNPDWLVSVPKITKPAKYVLNNKKSFINWFDSTYGDYRVKKDSLFVKSAKFDYFNHQKIIRDYVNHNSPFRGLLLYHGLGVGKTCGSIAIAEGFRTHKKVVVLLNKSLSQNFRDNLKFCGFDYFRTNQHWFFHKFEGKDDNMKKYAQNLGITIKQNLKGAWFIDFKKEPNYGTLTKDQKAQVDRQIEELIDKRYTFVNMDGLNEKKLISMEKDRAFDDCVLVVDEVHNLTNAMSKGSPGKRATYLEKIIMDAKNINLVFLSGTPMINNLFETAKLFNLLRGYIYSYEITVSPGTNFDLIETTLSTSKIIDQYFIDKRNKKITLTRVPSGFVKANGGIVKKDGENMYTPEEFKEHINSFITTTAFAVRKFTAFPNKEEDFMKIFFDNNKDEFKNLELFKSRILGLVSYYRTQDKGLIPEVTKDEEIKVPMSEYQFMKYAKIRKDEIENDKQRSKNKKKKKPKKDGEIFEIKSSYRAYSRMHCSFVFPESIPRPYPINEEGEIDAQVEKDFNDLTDDKKKEIEKKKKKEKKEKDKEKEFKDLTDDEKKEIGKKKKKETYETEKDKALKELDAKKLEYLTTEPDKLEKYSPKYNTILESIKKNKGTSFIYTEYKTLEGIATLSIVLKANGYAPFLLKKNSAGEYIQDYENPEDVKKPKFAFWGGGKPEESEILRKVYNNEFEDLPKTLKEQLEKTSKTNLRGESIELLLTTKTGAEGIDLKNVRQVHIVEPYWNPVRIKQIKGRAVRVGSHIQLPKKERNVEIFLYLSTITDAMKKTDKVIQMDKGGTTSDEVLYELSQKKLKVMNTLLQLIKEASIDCSLNYNDTYSPDQPFTCLSYGTSLDSSYSYIPDVTKQTEDKDLKRKILKTSWKPEIVSLKIKGVKTKFALRPAPDGEPKLIYDFNVLKESGRPGEPIGEIKIKDGKKIVKFYKKTT